MSVSIDGAGSLIGVDQGLNIVGLTTLTGGIILDDSISHIGDADTKIRFPAADTFTVETAGNEAIRVDSSGRIIIGKTSSIASLADSKIEAVSGAGAEIHLARNDSSVTDGNAIGILRFYGNDGGTYQECARINCQADGTHADGDKPSRLTFYTTPSGAQTSTEKLRITSDGKVGVNDTTPDATLSVGGSTAFIDIGAAGGNRGKIGYSSNNLYFGTSSSSGEFIFKNNVTSADNPASSGTERVRIDSNGRQYHYTDGSLRMHLNATGLGVNTTTITGGRLIHAHNTGTGSAYFQSTNSNTGEGSSSGALYGVSGTTCYAPWNYINGPIVFATNSSEKMRIHATGVIQCGTSATLKAEINNSVSGHQFISQCSDNNNGFEVYQQHGSNTTRNTFAVYANTGSSNAKNLQFAVRGDGAVTKPGQPLAIMGTTQNNWSPSAGDVLPFNYSNTNRGNHYNTSNYTFTCPVAGDYMVILRLSRKGWCGDLELAKNNSQYVRLELRETGRNASNAADWQAWCYDFIVPCAANDTLKWKAPSVYTGTGSGNYLLDGYNHIYYDAVTYYLMG